MNGLSRRAIEPLWNAIPFPSFVLDGEDLIVAANQAAEIFVSASYKALRDKPIARFAGMDSAILDLVRQVRREGVSFAQHDVEVLWLDRAPVLASVQASPVHENEGDILLTIQPRSIADRMDRSLNFRSAARSVTGMAAMLAHEIKNPLAGISGAAQLLEMGLSPEDRELAVLIREEAERIGKLLERVEQFGDLRPIARDPVNIHDVISRARLSAEAGFASHVKFVEEYDPSLPPTIGDGDQLMQVMLNLLKNAAEATPEVGGVISIRTAYRQGVLLSLPGGGRESLPLQITVSDNGRGVPEDMKKDLFEPFVSSKAAGSGLGLSLVSKIITDHGGAIEFDSDPGWTTFRVLLPVWRDPDATRRRVRKGAV
ncbi:MAG: two-component system sensor histidine kinase NtrB [Rubricella sp.]